MLTILFFLLIHHQILKCVFLATARQDKKSVVSKTKEESMAEKKQELEKRLQDVTGQLGTPAAKKTPKKG